MNSDRLVNRLTKLIEGKRVLVLGYDKEGRSTYRILTNVGGFSCLDIADSNPALPNSTPSDVTIIGDNYLDVLENYDIVFQSQGFVLPDNISDFNCYISSQTDVFLSEYSTQTIGITGTKGKSTVATLLYHVLESAGYDVVLAGNIGTPVFDIATQITPATKIVLELSCHQLEYCRYSPSVAVLLNIFEDHLDRYGTFERYIQAKKNIYRFQNKRDVLYTHLNNLPITINTISQVHDVTTVDLPFHRFEDVGGVRLRGQHNLLNASFVHDICLDISIGKEVFENALLSYNPLPHRLEFIGNKNGVDFYDDSISTTVESSICAVQSVPNAKTLILGGMDRGIDYTPLIDFLIDSNLSTIIGMYDSGKRIQEMYLKHCEQVNSDRFIYTGDLYKATELAQKRTFPGTACLLSPAATTGIDFIDFVERGNVFKKQIFE